MPLAEPQPRSKIGVRLWAGALLLGLVAAGRLWIGNDGLGLPADAALSSFVLELRGARLWSAAVVGVCLALGGVALQALLRNALAEPFVLGLSGGAAAGVMAQGLVMSWGLGSLSWAVGLGPWVGAILGSTLATALVWAAGQRRGVLDPLGLLLAGVVLSAIFGAAVMVMHLLAGESLRSNLARWMMGMLDESASPTVRWAGTAVALLAWLWMFKVARAIDVATLGDEEARSLGVAVARLRLGLFLVASVTASAAVVLSGPVAFVGLIGPHLARTMLGPSHRALVPGAALAGALLVIGADTAGAAMQLAIPRLGLVPLGVFTAILGGPAFLWLLRPQLGRGSF